MPKIEPVRCVCGRKPEIHEHFGDDPYVYCNRRRGYCWTGPTRTTTRGAVKAWNRVMTAAKEADNG